MGTVGRMRHQRKNFQVSVRTTAAAAALVVAAPLALTACSGTDGVGGKAAPASPAAPETATAPAEATPDQQSATPNRQDAAPAAPAAGSGDVPAAVTGYTDEARAEMADENVSEADVEMVLQAAHDGKAEVEWEDDGYFEIEFEDIDVDIDPQGLVRDVDR